MSWQEKKDQAVALLNEAKAASSSGSVDTAESAEQWQRKVADAQRLMTEVKAERAEEEKGKLASLLEQAETMAKGDGEYRPEVRSQFSDSTAGLAGMKGDSDLPRVDRGVNPYDEMFRPKTRMIARQRNDESFQKMASDMRFKALGEGTTGAGGFLVPPTYMQDLFAETRRQGNALRRYGMLAEHPVESNQVLLPRGSGAASVGIVSESATKPSADQAYTQVTINIFTWAGISKVSKQLVMDSSPTAADLVNRELGTLLGNLEEQKIINGSGTGEPRGILNTTGITSTSATGTTAQSIIDNILDAIVGIQTTYFAPPNGLLMHPRRWAYLAKAKDSQNNYLLNNPGVFRAPASWPGGVTSQSTGGEQSMPSILGLPIAISANIPTTLTSNQDAIIVGDWNQAHWFQRQDVTMDVSDEAGTAFETNQVWYRLEERAGFSAERYPSAFAVLTGTALALT